MKGDIVDVAFNITSSELTKVSFDGDGEAASVNRYIVEAYVADCSRLYTRSSIMVASGTRTAHFKLKLVAGQTYNFLFWADCSNSGEDMYYNTSSSRGLQSVSMVGEYQGNHDSRDAFYASRTIHVAAAFTQEIILKRPFAQLNIITTDIDDVYQEFMIPDEVSVEFSAKTSFNVYTEECTGPESLLKYKALPYYQTFKSEENSAARKEVDRWTLSMDYVFAPAMELSLIKVNLGVRANGNQLPTREISNVPFRRNYRTNICGELLTVDGAYNVFITPDWYGEKNM